MRPHFILGICLLILTVFLVPFSSHADQSTKMTRRLRESIHMYSASILLWPAIILIFFGFKPFLRPLPALIILVVLFLFRCELTALSTYTGPLESIETSDAVYERNTQVTTVAFAVAMLLFSHGNRALTSKVAFPIMMALLFCTLSTVPSILAKRRLSENGRWNAIFKMLTSFAAGLLCLSLVICLDALLPTQFDEQVSVEAP